jgi:hypothetical protein
MLHRVLEFVGSCEHGNEHSGSVKGGEFDLVNISFSRITLLHGVSYDFSHLIWGLKYGGKTCNMKKERRENQTTSHARTKHSETKVK